MPLLPLLLGSAAALAAGSTSLPVSSFPVQTKLAITYVYRVGEGGLSAGDAIRVEDPLFHGMRWSKWGDPGLDPDACTALETGQKASISLVTAATTGSATLSVTRVTEDGLPVNRSDIHLRAFTQVALAAGSLAEGDEIRVLFGDTSTNALCGHETPDRAFRFVPWRTWEQVGEGEWTLVEPAPTFDVVADETVANLFVTAPSTVGLGTTVAVKVAPVDYLGNPVETWTGTVTVAADHGGASHTFSPADGGFHDFPVELAVTGIHRITVSGGGLTATSNPIEVTPSAPVRNLYWGDLHSHHGHSYTDERGRYVDQNHVYARDIAGLDVAVETQKAYHTEIDGDELWPLLQQSCREYTTDGEYVALLAWEWVGNHPAGIYYHHNIYYDDCNGPLGSHDEDVLTLEGPAGLYDWVLDATGGSERRAVLGPHAPRFTGNDWEHQDYELRRFIEVFSEWGNSMEPPNHADAVPAGLAAGNRFGFIAASDNHDGWMGNPWSYNRDYSGLAGFWAASLTRARLFDALANRHTFATTGHRPILKFAADDGGPVREGEALVARTPTFTWSYHGTDEISAMELVGVQVGGTTGTQRIRTVSAGGLDAANNSFTWKTWDGTTWAVWLQVTQVDGEKAWSSPIWVTRDCGLEEVMDPGGYCDGETGDTDADTDADTDTDTDADTDGRDDTAGDTGDGGGGCPCSAADARPQGALAALLALAAVVGRRRRERG